MKGIGKILAIVVTVLIILAFAYVLYTGVMGVLHGANKLLALGYSLENIVMVIALMVAAVLVLIFVAYRKIRKWRNK